MIGYTHTCIVETIQRPIRRMIVGPLGPMFIAIGVASTLATIRGSEFAGIGIGARVFSQAHPINLLQTAR
jgi:hypothetical protein